MTHLETKRHCSYSTEEVSRIGLVQVSHEGKLHFIHRTFAEYLVTDYFVNCLTEGNNISQQVLTFVLKDIFLKEIFRVIRGFIDCLLVMSKPTKEALKQYGNGIHDLRKDGVTICTSFYIHCSVHHNIFY